MHLAAESLLQHCATILAVVALCYFTVARNGKGKAFAAFLLLSQFCGVASRAARFH